MCWNISDSLIGGGQIGSIKGMSSGSTTLSLSHAPPQFTLLADFSFSLFSPLWSYSVLMCVQFSCIWLPFVHKIMLCWYYKPWNYKPLSKLELKKKPIFYLLLTKYCFSSVDSEMLCCRTHIDMLRRNPLENWVISIFSGQFPDGFRLKLLTASIKGRPQERDKSNPLRRDSA